MRHRPQFLRFPGTLAGFAAGTAAFHGLLDAAHLAGPVRFDVELAFEEIAANIVRHGRPTEEVELAITFGDPEIVLTFEDDGVAFDPLQQAAPDVPASIEEAELGGLGLVLVRNVASRVLYERTIDQRNRLTIAIPAHRNEPSASSERRVSPL